MVYRADDPRLFGEVAVKILRFAEPDPFLSQEEQRKEALKQQQALQRFELEAKVVAKLQHFAIVPIYDFGRVQVGKEEYPFIVMRLMKGGSLEKPLQKGALALEEVVRIVERLAQALDKVHQQGIVHRDLKPANILLDEDGWAYLADFGIAKLLDAKKLLSESKSMHLTHTSAIPPGTPAYRSPEQTYAKVHRKVKLDGRSDIYSLGAIVYEMLTGKRPYSQARLDYSDATNNRQAAYQALMARAEASYQQGRLDEAIADYTKLLRLNPRDVSALVVRGQAYYQKGQLDQALADYHSALRLKPHDKELQKHRQQAYSAKPPPLGIGSERVCAKDGMVQVYVPAGKFLMGSRANDSDAYDNEKPQHEVYLDAYWIDKTPVTNAMFAKFVAETGYDARSRWQSKAGKGRDNHPVVCLSWNDAVAYAKWAARRLSTEACCTKAAGGTDERKWPWGNNPPTKQLCNFGYNVGDTTPVGKYPAGASPYHALDMSGNVWEWCHDTYSENYYASSPKANPPGPKSNKTKDLRGGSWRITARSSRARSRSGSSAVDRVENRVFRCAISPFLVP